MKKVFFEPTEFTPGVLFDPQKMEFKMWGNSRPEDLTEFYYPLTKWWEDFVEDIVKYKESKYPDLKNLELHIEIEYFNSASSKMIFDIFKCMRVLASVGIKHKVNWYYFEDDEDIYESAVELSYELEMKFN